MKQLYEVGEVVILQSPNLPQYNGEYMVHAMIQPFEDFTCRLSGKVIWTDGGISYVLDVPLLDVGCSEGAEAFWAPTSLRKKHEPSQQSFKDLMTTLKSPQKVEWD